MTVSVVEQCYELPLSQQQGTRHQDAEGAGSAGTSTARQCRRLSMACTLAPARALSQYLQHLHQAHL